MTRFDPATHARAMRAGGFWPDRGFDEYLVAALRATPDKLALVADRADRPAPLRISYRELEDRVARAAAALPALGVGAGDVVAVQLPNWWEFVVTSLACGRIGAVVNPLMPIFRERELGYIADHDGRRWGAGETGRLLVRGARRADVHGLLQAPRDSDLRCRGLVRYR